MDIMAYEMREDIFQRSTAIVARNDATALKQYLDGKNAAVEEHGEFAVSWHLKGLLSDCIGASMVGRSYTACIGLLLRADAQPVHAHLFRCRDPAIMATLLDHKPHMVNARLDGKTVLMEACCVRPPLTHSWSDALSMVRLLLARGADPALLNTDGDDAEHFARLFFWEYDGPELTDDDTQAFLRLKDLLVGVRRAGGATEFLKAPRVELARLRLLVARGRAQPPPFASPKNVAVLARLFGCAPEGKRFRPLPKEIFWHVLSYWRAARDDELDFTAAWPED
jgi:hypothetical protein